MTKKNPKVSSLSEQSEHGGGFAAGFFLGMLGGALGTLLFSTDKGKKVLQNLREEFEPRLAEMAETPEVQALVEEYEVVKEEVTQKVTEAQKKFPKFSARQPKS